MKQTYAFLVLAAAGGIAWWLWVAYRRFVERSRLAEERMASAITQATVSTKPKAAEPSVAAPKPVEGLGAMAQQKLLYDAAGKAAEAGEAVISIQLYARLLARYPDSGLGAQARAAVEALKKKLVVKS